VHEYNIDAPTEGTPVQGAAPNVPPLKIADSLMKPEPKAAKDRRASSNVSRASNEASAKMSRVSEAIEPPTDFNSKVELSAEQEAKEAGAEYQLPADDKDPAVSKDHSENCTPAHSTKLISEPTNLNVAGS
jgi:hypothetical protein